MVKKRTLRRRSRPWRFDEHALDGAAVRLDPSKGFDASVTTFDLEPTADPEPLDVEVALPFQAADLIKNTGLAFEDIEVCMTLEHRFSRTNVIIQRWSSGAVPELHAFRLEPADYSGRGCHVRVVAVLARARDQATAAGTAWRRGATLAVKSFAIRRPRSRSLFHVENTSFKERGWDPRALWFVDYRQFSVPHECPPEDYIEVHLNSDLHALQALWNRGFGKEPAYRATAHMVRRLVGTAILADISRTVLHQLALLRDEQNGVGPDLAEDSIGKLVLDSLERGIGENREDLPDLARDEPGVLNRRIQDWVRCGDAFDADALTSLRVKESEI